MSLQYNLGRVVGENGQDGDDGVGIASIEKTSTSGLVDTYTVTYTDGDTDTFTVTNGQNGTNGTNGTDGVGISSISKTGTSGLVDTYTITLSNGNTATFTVTNGEKGDTGSTGATGNGISTISKTGTSGLVDTYTITFTNGNSTTFTVTNGNDATVTIDSSLSSSSTNPVQNKVINTALGNKVNTSDIVDNLTTNDATKPLSAKQGKALNDMIGSAITYIVGSGS